MKKLLLLPLITLLFSCSINESNKVCSCAVDTYEKGNIDIDYIVSSESAPQYDCMSNNLIIESTDTHYKLIQCSNQ